MNVCENTSETTSVRAGHADTFLVMVRRRLLPLLVALGLVADVDTTQQAADAPGSLALVSGSQIDAGSIEGQDTVLWFWAPW